MQQLGAYLQASELLDLCTRGNTETGSCAARITLEPTGLSFRFGGSLVPTSAGACLSERIRALATERLGRESPRPSYATSVKFTSPPVARQLGP